MTTLTKQQRAEIWATRAATESQRIALGARLLYAELRTAVTVRRPFVIACIRLQTWY